MSRPFASLLDALPPSPVADGAHLVAPMAAAVPLIAGAHTDGLTLVLTATGNDAEALAGALGAYVDPDAIALFPSWETLPHERLSPRSDTIAQRLATLRRIAHPADAAQETGLPAPRYVVAPLRAALQPMAPGLADLEPVKVAKGDIVDLRELTEALVAAAYTRVDMVERRGEFAVRGGIVDVFAPTDPHPIRLEFFGDEVESLRRFSVADQRSLAEVDRLWAPPCRELLLTEEVRRRTCWRRSRAAPRPRAWSHCFLYSLTASCRSPRCFRAAPRWSRSSPSASPAAPRISTAQPKSSSRPRG